MGGHWINKGLPMYVAIDCKPENGCEIQDSCDARAQVMLHLKIVKQEHDDEEYLKQLEGGMQQVNGEKLIHGTKVCLDLLDPWRNAP